MKRPEAQFKKLIESRRVAERNERNEEIVNEVKRIMLKHIAVFFLFL